MWMLWLPLSGRKLFIRPEHAEWILKYSKTLYKDMHYISL
jgi:hypothetical protein